MGSNGLAVKNTNQSGHAFNSQQSERSWQLCWQKQEGSLAWKQRVIRAASLWGFKTCGHPARCTRMGSIDLGMCPLFQGYCWCWSWPGQLPDSCQRGIHFSCFLLSLWGYLLAIPEVSAHFHSQWLNEANSHPPNNPPDCALTVVINTLSVPPTYTGGVEISHITEICPGRGPALHTCNA